MLTTLVQRHSEHKQVEQLASSSCILAVCNPTVATYCLLCTYASMLGYGTINVKARGNRAWAQYKLQTSCKHWSESKSNIIGLLAQCENILENKWTSHLLSFSRVVSAFAQAKANTRFCLTLPGFEEASLRTLLTTIHSPFRQG